MPEKTKPARVTSLVVEDIAPNPHNPRRLFDEGPMQTLRESIEKRGILVPIVVYPKPRNWPGSASYVLLDGERRWRCAIDLRLPRVPAIVVAEPDETQNILTMFHIHNVREGWQLMPTALKLQTLMEKLDETNERKLSELTKLTIAQVRRCKILLTYPKTIQNLMLAPVSRRLKADFFIEMQRIRGPALSERFPPWIKRGDLDCIKILLDKYERNIIKAVTEFRKLAEVHRASENLGKRKSFMRKLDEFLDDPEKPVDHVSVPGATFAKEAKEINRSAKRLLAQVERIDFEEISSDEQTIALLRQLLEVIESKLDKALLIGARNA